MSQSNEMIIIIRPSFKKICGQDACRAALYNHLLYWIARKAKGQSEDKIKQGDISWYGTAEDICQGIDQSWCVNKVRQEVKRLVQGGLIGQRRNPANGWDQTRHYFIGEEQGEVLRAACEKYQIDLELLGLSDDVLHLLNLVNGFTKSGESNSQISEMDLPNTANRSTKSGNAIPKVTTKVSSSKDINKERESADSKKKSTSIRSSLFTSEQSRIDGYYCQHYSRPPKVTDKLKSDYDTLARDIRTQEDMDSLFQFTKARIKGCCPHQMLVTNRHQMVA